MHRCGAVRIPAFPLTECLRELKNLRLHLYKVKLQNGGERGFFFFLMSSQGESQ